jgi:hypothetical protein
MDDTRFLFINLIVTAGWIAFAGARLSRGKWFDAAAFLTLALFQFCAPAVQKDHVIAKACMTALEAETDR